MFDVLVCLNRTISYCLGVGSQELKIINIENLLAGKLNSALVTCLSSSNDSLYCAIGSMILSTTLINKSFTSLLLYRVCPAKIKTRWLLFHMTPLHSVPIHSIFLLMFLKFASISDKDLCFMLFLPRI